MKFKLLCVIVSMSFSLSTIVFAEDQSMSPDGGDQSMQVTTNDAMPDLNSDNNNADVKVVDTANVTSPLSGANDSEVNIDTTTGDDDY